MQRSLARLIIGAVSAFIFSASITTLVMIPDSKAQSVATGFEPRAVLPEPDLAKLTIQEYGPSEPEPEAPAPAIEHEIAHEQDAWPVPKQIEPVRPRKSGRDVLKLINAFEKKAGFQEKGLPIKKGLSMQAPAFIEGLIYAAPRQKILDRAATVGAAAVKSGAKLHWAKVTDDSSKVTIRYRVKTDAARVIKIVIRRLPGFTDGYAVIKGIWPATDSKVMEAAFDQVAVNVFGS